MLCMGFRYFPGGSVVKNPPAMQEMRVWSLGQEDPLEKGKATHSSILLVGCSPRGHKESDMTEQLDNNKCMGFRYL